MDAITFILLLLGGECSPTIVAFSPHGPEGYAWVQIKNVCETKMDLHDWAVFWGKTVWTQGGINAPGKTLPPGACHTWWGLPIHHPYDECAVGVALFGYDDNVFTDLPSSALSAGGDVVCGLPGLDPIPEVEWPEVGEAIYVIDGEAVLDIDTGPIHCPVWRPIPGPTDEKAP